jgi:hypothetical protein
VDDATVQRFIRLGLRLDRHVEGTVDAYFGPKALAGSVRAEPLTAPHALVTDADGLLAELPDGWLRDQVVGLRTYAGVLAGESRSWADEVAGCYGVRPARTDESVFAAAHERLADLLPGTGSLAERHERWRESALIPGDRVAATVEAVVATARAATGDLVDLPDGESVVVEAAHDVPWMGFNYYLGDLRGRVAVNVDLPMSGVELLHLAIHETYPGHQAERACKEHLLVRGEGRLEESIVLAPTPQSVVAEGIGQLAPRLLLGGEHGEALAAVVRDTGVEVDLGHALAVNRALAPCRWVEVNAALMLHEDGLGEADVQAYLERWGLATPELARHAIRFMTEPTSRTYIVNYPAGLELCEGYVGGDPNRFRRLLTEQVRVGELQAAVGPRA